MTLKYFYTLLKEYKKPLLLVVLLMVAESAVSLVVPWFAGQFSKSILDGEALFGLRFRYIAAIWLLLFAFQALLRFLSTFRINLIGATMLTNLSCRLYDHIQVLPIKYFNTTKKGEILSLLSNDAAIISFFLSGVLASLVPSVLILSGSIILMATINITITIMIVCMVPAFFIILKILGRGLRPLTQTIVQRQADSVAIASENFSAIKLVKAFSRETIESARFKNNAHDIQKLRTKQLKIQALLSPLIQLLVSSGVLVVVIVSAISYQSGALSMPNMITLLMYGMLFARPMSGLAHLYGQVQQALGASTRITDILNIAPEPVHDTVHNSALSLPSSVFSQGIIFKQVGFSYSSEKPLLQKVNLNIYPNEIVVMLGANGEGKTTLLHLLMRFIEPGSGEIILDGHSLQDINLSQLRKHIGLVSQDIALCNGTIMDNIAYGYPESSASDIEQAAIKAGAHEFICTLGQGYATLVGENGVLLSGGQRQRISLARTLLSQPSILLLDEPTSMFDIDSKDEFQLNAKTLFENQTVVIVTHDEKIAALADRVFTIENGTISERRAQ